MGRVCEMPKLLFLCHLTEGDNGAKRPEIKQPVSIECA